MMMGGSAPKKGNNIAELWLKLALQNTKFTIVTTEAKK